jgi:Ca2+-binding RTX toxin-like protein
MDGGEGSDLYIVAASADHVAAEIADTGASGTDEVRFTSTIAGSTLTLYAGDAGIEKVVIGTGMDLETTAETDRTGTTALNVDASALSSDITVWDNYGNNVITGGSGNDVLWGSYGNDILIGGDGFDQLCGGLGTDTLTGGNGADWFIFKSNPYSGSNADTITDFTSGTDQLQFSKAIFIGAVNFKGLSGAALGDLSSDAFWSGAGVTTAHDADDRFIYNTTNGYLYYDNDGNALRDQAVLVAILGATTPLVFTDLQIIV